ncbi:ribonuclease P protein component [Hanamia caeni]|uniref:Ribonuclease P protein component n=1 Tax=Hanamia caeni TaxID=2294116 RepID=A0A3M9NJH7_9BACT|nr:ribonuclease P protein component [Hanamia caeni]RNI37861.1 ribonuclease P protein component [Hanamia caeni]
MTSRATFKRKEKLKSRKTIQKLFNEGKSFSNFPIKAIYLPVEKQDFALKAGFAVSSKNFKKAVERNRVKRLMRESYRVQKNYLSEQLISTGQQLVVFFIYTSKELPDYHQVFQQMQIVLERIGKAIAAK